MRIGAQAVRKTHEKPLRRRTLPRHGFDPQGNPIAPARRRLDAVRDVGHIHERLCPGFLTIAAWKGRTPHRHLRQRHGREGMIIDLDDKARRVAWSAVAAPVAHNASMQIFIEGEGCRRCGSPTCAEHLAGAIAG